MTDFSSEEFLALELQERLRELNCHVPYDMAVEQVQNFLAAETKESGVSVEEYLAERSDENIIDRWVDRVVAVAKRVNAEVEEQYPLLAMPLTDAGVMITMIATTVEYLHGVPGNEEISGAALQVVAALGKQVAAAEGPSSLCLLTQVETFALSVAVRSLRQLPPDVTCAPHMEWVASCDEMLDSCFNEIAERQADGVDLSDPERRVFVVSMVDDDADDGTTF